MKKTIFLLLLVFICSKANAQSELWGMTSYGGNGGGIIYKTDSNGESFQVVHKFVENAGQWPCSGLCAAANGKYYGMTTQGGSLNYGSLFEYNPITNDLDLKVMFTGPNGFHGVKGMITTSSGKLYGLTNEGGLFGNGVLFEYDVISNTYLIMHNFRNDSSGGNPCSSMLITSNDKIYGATSHGGIGHGVLFEYDLIAHTYSKKIDFDESTTGISPLSLIQASNSKIYGTMTLGGLGENVACGTLFRYSIDSNIFTTIFEFDSINGGKPCGDLMQASNGKIYGMTRLGGSYNNGVIFELDPLANSLIKKVDFESLTTGVNPSGPLTELNGKLYGTNYDSGLFNYGVLFEYDPLINTITKRFDFGGNLQGVGPIGTFVKDGTGELYGLTSGGGIKDYGTLYKFDPDSNICTKKIDFWNNLNGETPQGSLLHTADNMLYGMTSSGGVNNAGVLFKYDIGLDQFEKKIDFKTLLSGKNTKLF